MAKPIPNLRFTGLDDDGNPLVGGLLYSYIAGTTTPLTTYSDPAGTVPNTNPVVLDAGGRAPVFLGARSYKFVLHNALDALVYEQDNIDGTETVQNTTIPWASHPFTDGQAAAALAGETVDLALYQAAIYDAHVVRGTKFFTGQVVVQKTGANTARAVTQPFAGDLEDPGLTFDVSISGTVATLRLATSAGPGAGTIDLSRRLIPV